MYLKFWKIFEICNKCIEIYELDPTYFFSTLESAWQAGLIKTEIESELLADIDILLMIGKDIRGGICHAIQSYGTIKWKATTKIKSHNI